jgi:hypothetical protein
MKTIELHPLLQQVRDALPERIQDRVSDKHSRGDYLDLPLVGFLSTVVYDKIEGLSLSFSGYGKRARHYPIRKDGSVNVAKIVEVVTEVFDEQDAFHREYAEERHRRDEESRQAEANFAAVSSKLRLGRRYRRGKEGEHITYVGGCHLIHKKSDVRGEIWSDGEGCVKGKIPFAGLDVPTFNAIMSILNGHEFRILDEKRS